MWWRGQFLLYSKSSVPWDAQILTQDHCNKSPGVKGGLCSKWDGAGKIWLFLLSPELDWGICVKCSGDISGWFQTLHYIYIWVFLFCNENKWVICWDTNSAVKGFAPNWLLLTVPEDDLDEQMGSESKRKLYGPSSTWISLVTLFFMIIRHYCVPRITLSAFINEILVHSI